MSEIENKGRQSDNKVLAANLGVDFAKEWAMGEGLDRLTAKLKIPLESLAGGVGKKALSKLASAPAVTAIEIGKGLYKLRSPDARDGDAEKGRQLMQEPAWYQVANTFLNSADAMSEYGAAIEESDKKAFDKANDQGWQSINAKVQEKYARSSLARMEDDQTNRLIEDIAYNRSLREKNEMTRAAAKESGKPMGPLYGVEKETEYNRKQLAEQEKMKDKEITMNMIRSYFKDYA
jgi:hypothetical protein